MWGEQGEKRIIGALPADVRARTGGLLPLPDWLPVDDLIAWHEAAWEGPVAHNEDTFMQLARVTIDQGFGKVKRFLISMASPHMLAARVSDLWRDEYSTGRLETLKVDDRAVALALREHPFVHNPLMRRTIAEAYRHVLSMTSAKEPTVEHQVRGGALVVTLRWT